MYDFAQASKPQIRRLRVSFGFIILMLIICIVRLFYLQVIRYDYYRQSALSIQKKERAIPAERGLIYAHDGDQLTPLVLNETLYTLFADPIYVNDAKEAGQKLASIINLPAELITESIKPPSRYVVLAKKLNKQQKNQVESLKLKGIGTREASYRTYPQGQLAAQLLGFVNDDQQGRYGVEQALEVQLAGHDGLLKAITDASGVPLASNKDNILIPAKAGNNLALTIDIGMQRQTEELLKKGLERAKSSSGGVIIIDPNSGAVKAMANWPSYNPARYFDIKDLSLFNNRIVSDPLEIGSTMKPFTAGAAIDQGLVSPTTQFYDPGRFVIGDATVTNVEEVGGAANRSVADIIRLSLNTGATWLLMQMGGGEINAQARKNWHRYLTDHYQFGKLTNIEQGFESAGRVPDPVEGFGLNITFANTTFGQGLLITPVQLAAGLASLVNGGTYYQPHIISGQGQQIGSIVNSSSKIVKSNVVSTATSQAVRQMMENAFSNNYYLYGMPKLRSEYAIGGKSGTAQITKPGGGYFDNLFNGTFIGYVGGEKVEYVIVVRVDKPQIAGYAGSKAAGPLFVDLANMLIDNFAVAPKGQ